MKHIIVTVLAVLAVVLVACTTSPTGRDQLILFPSSQMSQMGITAFSDMQKKQTLEKSPTVNKYVQCVTDALLPHLPQSLAREAWEVSVFKDDSPNAFALPGGKIGVHTGMLSLADSQGQLAAVIGHEIGHVWAQHGNERMSQQMLAQTGMQVVESLAGEPSPEKNMAMAALGLAAQGTVLKYSRDHESEADLMGLQMMAKAGFDPREAVTLWQTMAKKSTGQRPPEFLSTHPSEATRIKQLQGYMAKVLPIYQQAQRAGRKPACR